MSKRMALCHSDRPNYSKDLCKSCYNTLNYKANHDKWPYRYNSEDYKERYAKNKEVIKAYQKDQYAKHKEARKQNSTNYAKANRDKVLSYLAEYRKRNKDAAKEWRRKNSALCRAYGAERRAAQDQRTPYWLSSEHRKQIVQFYKEAKELNKTATDPYQVDHIVPLRGKEVSGLHVPWNLQLLPKLENIRKKNKF